MTMVTLTSFVNVHPHSHFPIQNLPFGIFAETSDPNAAGRVGVAIGDYVLDLAAVANAHLLDDVPEIKPHLDVFNQNTLNAFMALGKPAWQATRRRVQHLLAAATPTLRDDASLRDKVLIPQKSVHMRLPAAIGDYTDFYASREHATNVGTMFRGKDNALMPNWLHLPVGYHGRSSSIVVSGHPITRPCGQTMPKGADCPTFGASQRLDFELEMAALIGTPNPMGVPIPIEKALDHVFGVVLMNDWSARDIQAFEYVPLGPFLGKNFGTTISPWVVTLDALEPFLCPGPAQDNPTPLPYLKDATPSAYDIRLQVSIKPDGSKVGSVVSDSNLKYMYWSLKQQVTHHAVNGCPLRTGDLLGTGTISGPTPSSFGSLLELSWSGRDQVTLAESGPGITRTFLQDKDEVTLTGWCQADGFRVGFGEATGKILPAAHPLL